MTIYNDLCGQCGVILGEAVDGDYSIHYCAACTAAMKPATAVYAGASDEFVAAQSNDIQPGERFGPTTAGDNVGSTLAARMLNGED